MKKCIKGLVAMLPVLLFSVLPMQAAPAFAVEDGDTAQSVTDDRGDAAATLYIDTQHTYAGMACSYAEGYRPTVCGNAVQVVLPLLAGGEVRDGTITAMANIDFSAESPFVCKNYEKTVVQSDNAVAGETTVAGFLVAFDLELNAARKNGSYPVSFSVTASNKNGAPIVFESTVYVAITDGKAAASEEEQADQPATTLKLDSQNVYPDMDCSYCDGYRPKINEQTVRLVLPLLADGALKDHCVTAKLGIDFSAESPFVCNNYEKTVALAKNQTANAAVSGYLVTFDLKLSQTRKNGNYPVTISVNSTDQSNQPVAFETVVYVVIADQTAEADNAVKMEFDELQLPAEVTVSDVFEAPVKAMNLGKCKVYHVRAALRGDGLFSNGTAFLGDMEPGTAMDGSISVSVTALSGDVLYGNTDGVVTYTYEDEAGKEYTVERPFSTRIQSPFSEQTEQIQDNPKQWWGIMTMVSAVLVVVVAVSAVLYRKKRGRNGA